MLRIDCLSKVTDLWKTGGQAKVEGYLEAQGLWTHALPMGQERTRHGFRPVSLEGGRGVARTSSSQWLKRARP